MKSRKYELKKWKKFHFSRIVFMKHNNRLIRGRIEWSEHVRKAGQVAANDLYTAGSNWNGSAVKFLHVAFKLLSSDAFKPQPRAWNAFKGMKSKVFYLGYYLQLHCI